MNIEQGDIIVGILKKIQGDVVSIRREQTSQGVRLAAIEDHQRGIMTSLFGMQSDISELKTRVDRIEIRLGLADTEH